MSYNDEKNELTIVPEKSRLSVALNALIVFWGGALMLLSSISLSFKIPMTSLDILTFSFQNLMAFAFVIFSGRNLGRFFLVPYYTITLKPDSIVFDDFKTGKTDKVINADDIECVTYRDLTIVPKKRTFTYKRDRISVRDYSKRRSRLIFQSDLTYSDLLNDFKINRIALDKEKMGITISPEISRYFTLGGNLLLALFGFFILIEGINFASDKSMYLVTPLFLKTVFSLFFILLGLIAVFFAGYSFYRYFFVANQTIILKNDSIVFENDETGEVEKTITQPEIELQIHNNLIILLKNGQKIIISVKDYVKGRFFIIPNLKTQYNLSNRILTFIAENYDQVFVPGIVLTNETTDPQ